ncbi:MAG: SAM-dependent methyltransferase [Betaproteobacteria bacterium]|nr:SAM-dependent methyltransferase [Betaproteobacteria bacterium]
MVAGTLYLIPTTLGESPLSLIIPQQVQKIAAGLTVFVAENPKTARQYLKQLELVTPLQEIEIFTLDKHTKPAQLTQFLQPALAGKDIGLVSEAGCPAVADPGALLVRLAHEKGLRVVPLVGPSSILLALMASGMNGQAFAFHGYLPIQKAERGRKISGLEKESILRDQTQIFIETPYRNQAMFEDIIQVCEPGTELCIATDITLITEHIETRTIAEWRKKAPDINKKPTIFLLYRPRSG